MVLAAFALFVILEAVVATLTRAHFGVAQALALRYTTCTLLLAASLIGAAWRIFPQPLSRIATTFSLAAVMYAGNPTFVEDGWRARNQEMDAIAAEIRKGNLPPDAAAKLCNVPDIVELLIWRFKDAGLGPFAKGR